MATWPSGKAEACKAFTPGSNPGVAFFMLLKAKNHESKYGKYGVKELLGADKIGTYRSSS